MSCFVFQCWSWRLASRSDPPNCSGYHLRWARSSQAWFRQSTLSQQAAQETLPLRDAFAVLFFVSVGMLFDPSIIMREPGPVVATFLIIVCGNALAAFLIVLALRQPFFTAVTGAAALSQIGEFSFILAGLGVTLQLLPETARDLILAGAILSILANPILFFALDKARPWLGEPRTMPPASVAETRASEELPVTSLRNHAVIVGCGRVGSLVAEAMMKQGEPFLVIEERREVVDQLRRGASRQLREMRPRPKS